ncbi:MAG: DEAD/DEAH box helicase [Deltaproteobacteria bacterium]|jgi:hypothetical protein|nr:DEAD/DEAH box helicase [Deltaproteobacteria bacterium]
MRVYHPVFTKEDVLYVFATWTTPLLQAPARLHIGDEVHELEEGPPYELIGSPVWHKAEEMALLGRELHQRVVFPEINEGSGAFLARMSRGDVYGGAPLKCLARFRPPLETEEPLVFMAFTLSPAGHAPLELSPERKRRIRSFLREHRALGLFHKNDVPYFTGRASPGEGAAPGEGAEADAADSGAPNARGGARALLAAPPPRHGLQVKEQLLAWRMWSDLKRERREPPFATERSCLALPDAFWMKSVAEFFGLIPLKWADSGSFFQGSPSAHTWGEALSAAAPSSGFKGAAEDLFPVPILSGSLLDIALSSYRDSIFISPERADNPPKKHILVTGPTGTGKTLLGTFILLNECLERKKPVIYLGPTRMLVEDAHEEFKRVLAILEKGQRRGGEIVSPRDVIVSTGESYQDDARIAVGDFRVAFVVYEKVSNFFIGSDLARILGMALIDELHMLGDRTRGVSLDATLGRLVLESRRRLREGGGPLRLMCLSTGAMAGDPAALALLTLNDEGGPESGAESIGGKGSAGGKPSGGGGAFPRRGVFTGRADPKGRAAGEEPGGRAPRALPPLVLSVYERPQRLLIYVQPTASRHRFRPVHVSRLQDRLELSDLVLDEGEGAGFNSCLEGWIPGHEKIIYASYSWNSLLAFVNKMLSLGRREIPAVAEDGFFLKNLEKSLFKSGIRGRDGAFYLHCAKRGVFFHFSGLEKETRRLMAEGYRRFQPLELEPFILCATETISYGVNLPADALFLETVMWPRSRHDRYYAIESLTNNEFKNLTGRVGRHGHIKSGVIPTVFVNWKLGKAESVRMLFPRKKLEMERICSSAPLSAIDCGEIGRLLTGAFRFRDLRRAPLAAGRFFLLVLLHASSILQGETVGKGKAENPGASAPAAVDEDLRTFLRSTYVCQVLPPEAGGADPPPPALVLTDSVPDPSRGPLREIRPMRPAWEPELKFWRRFCGAWTSTLKLWSAPSGGSSYPPIRILRVGGSGPPGSWP